MAGLVTGGVLHDASVVIGLKNTLDATAEIARTAEHSITGDMFILYADNALHAALAEAKPGLDITFLADPEKLGGASITSKMLGGIGAKVTPHGAMPNKVHAKSLVVDGADGMISSGAWFTDGGKRNNWLDLAVRVRGDAARAVEQLTLTSVAGDRAAFEGAAHAAAQQGIYINDPAQGVMELGPQVRHMIENASERLIIATKRTDSPEVDGMLQAARDRGVEVTRYDRGVTGKTLHGNVIVADNVAYIGSGMLNNRTLKGSGSSGRMSRELGVVIDGPAVDDVVTAISTKMDAATAARIAPVASPTSHRTAIIAGGVGVAATGGAYLGWRALQ